jgi:hypothetical protein
VLRRTYQFEVNASVEEIYSTVLQPNNWFSFYPGYQGLESVDGDWPAKDSAIVVRYGPSAHLRIQLRQVVTSHETGRRINLHEEAIRGLWIDTPCLEFEPKVKSTLVSLTIQPSSRILLAFPVASILGLLFGLALPGAARRFEAIAEGVSG